MPSLIAVEAIRDESIIAKKYKYALAIGNRRRRRWTVALVHGFISIAWRFCGAANLHAIEMNPWTSATVQRLRRLFPMARAYLYFLAIMDSSLMASTAMSDGIHRWDHSITYTAWVDPRFLSTMWSCWSAINPRTLSSRHLLKRTASFAGRKRVPKL